MLMIFSNLFLQNIEKTSSFVENRSGSLHVGVPPMIAKSMTDRLNENNEYSFHLGTTDPELRKIASWSLPILTM